MNFAIIYPTGVSAYFHLLHLKSPYLLYQRFFYFPELLTLLLAHSSKDLLSRDQIKLGSTGNSGKPGRLKNQK